MPKNGNITGEVFDAGVVDQIKYRQNFLGARAKQDPHIIYGNNVNAFLRLASSVNVGTSPSPIQVQVSGSTINDSVAQEKAKSNLLSQGKDQLKVRGINENLTGMELAKACVLFGGTVGVDDKLNPKFKFGIVDNGGSGAYDYVSTIAAYGWGGINSKGFVPMPSIEEANVSFFNRGALAKATVKIKVYSVEQLQIFDALYFRIGYTMLLEWGHNIWIDNALSQNTNNTNPLKSRNEFVTQPFELFFKEGTTQQDIINSIHAQRENDSYNYDAMLGKVTNFTWKFNEDGSYDIDLNLVGLGDVIESLKINKAAIVTNKTELTPSQLAAKKQANIDAGYKAADNKEKVAADKVKKAQEDFKKQADAIKPQIESTRAKLQEYLKKINPDSFTDYENPNTGDEVGNQIIYEFKGGIDGTVSSIQTPTDASQGPQVQKQITAALQEVEKLKAKIISTETFTVEPSYGQGGTTIPGYTVDGTDIWNKGTKDFIGRFKNIYSVTKSYLNQLQGLVKKLTGASEAAAQAAADEEAAKKAAENQRRGLDAASQKLKRDEEVRSLSPVTSVETKNKTLLNLQLYEWRKLAENGNYSGFPGGNSIQNQAFEKQLGNKNLYKLTFTADSSNPSSTGTTKLSLNFYYVRLGFLLNWIQNNLLIYDNTKSFNPNAITFESKAKNQPVVNSNLVLGDQTSTLVNLSPSSLATSVFQNTLNTNTPSPDSKTPTPPKEANPIFEIDTDPEKNFCLRFPAQFSADPKVCIIPSKYGNKIDTSNTNKIYKEVVAKNNIFWNILPELKDYFVDGNEYAAKLMNMYVNIDHAAGCVDKNTDSNGKTSLLNFLTALFNDINDALGNVNKLEPIFDAESNKLKIIEGSSIEKVEELINAKEMNTNPMAVFQVYGIGTENTPYGSFIKNVDFQVQLPPNMAAMATISAQASGNIVGENATGLSKLNTGLIDRLITIKLDKDSIEGAQTGKLDPKVIFQQNLQAVQKVINSLYVNKFYSKDTIDSIRSTNRDIALYLTGNDALEGNMPAPFFIPFNLSLEMDGLSGMRNYERFSITEQILPYSYRPNSSTNRNGVIDFLIKGVSHSIRDNKWTTKIETLSVSSNRKWSLQDVQNVNN